MAPAIQVEFRIEYITVWGEQLWIELLGAADNSSKRHLMKWTASHIWTATLPVYRGTRVRYRYVLTREAQPDVVRREGVVHCVAPSADCAATEAVVVDAWDVAGFDATAALLAMSMALHPRLGAESPAGMSDTFTNHDIGRLLLSDADIVQQLQRHITVTAIRVRDHFHAVRLQQPRRDTGWRCDMRPCAGGYVRFHMTTGVDRYTCRGCDFDICMPCAKQRYRLW